MIPSTPAPAPSGNGSAIVAEAYKHIGKPYVWGAKGPNTFDCSGFTRYVYLQVTGRDIGGWTVPQEGAGTIIPVSQAQPGDLYFWGSRGSSYQKYNYPFSSFEKIVAFYLINSFINDGTQYFFP